MQTFNQQIHQVITQIDENEIGHWLFCYIETNLALDAGCVFLFDSRCDRIQLPRVLQL